jgi:ribosomal protein S6--L-glutamate ligase
MRIAFLLTRHPPDRPSPIFPEVVRLLRARGASVDVVHPDERLTELRELRVEHDLYVLKSGGETALSLAGALHSLGAAILNPYPAASICRDKIVASRVLEAAGIPAPASYACSRPAQLIPLLEDGPLIVKPYRGSQGRGVRIVHRASELLDGGLDTGPLFAQRYLPPEGRDRKLYRIGDDVFGVERVWPARTYDEKLGRPFEVSNELREIAFACGAALGLSLFGFDVVVSEGRPFVVDISSFPGFKGVPNAAVRLADYVERSAARFGTRRRVAEAPEHVPA